MENVWTDKMQNNSSASRMKMPMTRKWKKPSPRYRADAHQSHPPHDQAWTSRHPHHSRPEVEDNSLAASPFRRERTSYQAQLRPKPLGLHHLSSESQFLATVLSCLHRPKPPLRTLAQVAAVSELPLLPLALAMPSAYLPALRRPKGRQSPAGC